MFRPGLPQRDETSILTAVLPWRLHRGFGSWAKFMACHVVGCISKRAGTAAYKHAAQASVSVRLDDSQKYTRLRNVLVFADFEFPSRISCEMLAFPVPAIKWRFWINLCAKEHASGSINRTNDKEAAKGPCVGADASQLFSFHDRF